MPARAKKFRRCLALARLGLDVSGIAADKTRLFIPLSYRVTGGHEVEGRTTLAFQCPDECTVELDRKSPHSRSFHSTCNVIPHSDSSSKSRAA